MKINKFNTYRPIFTRLHHKYKLTNNSIYQATDESSSIISSIKMIFIWWGMGR